MKKYVVFSVIIIMTMFCEFQINAQNLLLLSKEKRDSTLIAIAKKVCMRDAPEFYREYGKPSIKEGAVEDQNDIAFRFWHNVKMGQLYYEVYFPYDKNKEEMEEDFAFSVAIWAETSKPFCITFGNGWFRDYKDGDW